MAGSDAIHEPDWTNHVFPGRESTRKSPGSFGAPATYPPARERNRLVWLGALLAGDWAVADLSEERHRREASGLVAAYLQWHLERGLRSLRLVDRG